jgi:hypothetical protein
VRSIIQGIALKTEESARPVKPPDSASLTAVREAGQHCTACH